MDSLAVHHEAVTVSVFAGLLLVAAAWDVWQYRIPNLLSALLLIAFVPAAALSPHPIAWWAHAAGALLVLGLGMALFAYGIMGGGDIKLLVAVSLWFGLAFLPLLLASVGMLGGVLAMMILALRMIVPGMLLMVGLTTRLPTVLLPKGAIPYGVAITAGALLNYRYLPVLGLAS
ncbi:MAG TPA: prepilin peptidase [Azospirillaceae bacterium]|nr:prepilin peptidase [Azospirillaceae bacterium]